MNLDALALSPGPSLAARTVAGRFNWPDEMEPFHPTRPGSKQLLHVRALRVRSVHTEGIEHVPRDLLSQVDYDWLVVDTNCSTDLMRKRECYLGLGMVNIRAGASWRRPRVAPRPVRGAGKLVDWPGSVGSASAEKGASRPLHAWGQRNRWETRRPPHSSDEPALRVSETLARDVRSSTMKGRGSITWMGHARIRGAVEQPDAADGAGEHGAPQLI